ncbi:hypothetical protein GSI_06116 [Ganoderma sinense ZZ0214-1]|uniref:Uncharacterized protein n=1 Tax=Ganoderma sinense ZZ0214-1 TaxID=1077348 RepID=A0A2G8SCB6_9APHY|nr:hypothetical protein GSI_06116 [Ganoderma sinense ZZ0214-1]
MGDFSSDGIRTLTLDVTKEDEINTVVATIIEAEGQIDILVNNAGIANKGAIIDVPMDLWHQIYETNVFSIVRMSKAVIPHMAARKRGMIINVGSILGQTPAPFSGVYASAKAAVHSISDTLYMECTPLNIDVVLVAPGIVRSSIARKAISNIAAASTTGLYSDYFTSAGTTLAASFGRTAMDTNTFAQRVVDDVLRPNPPRYLTLAPLARTWSFFEWLPRAWVLQYVWKVQAEGPRQISAQTN